jgi:hypothetical protein
MVRSVMCLCWDLRTLTLTRQIQSPRDQKKISLALIAKETKISSTVIQMNCLSFRAVR